MADRYGYGYGSGYKYGYGCSKRSYLCKLGWHIKDSALAICCQAHPLHLFHSVLRGHVLLEEGEDQSWPLDLCRGGEHESREVLVRCQQRPCLHSNITMLIIIVLTVNAPTQQHNTQIVATP